jgi:hypothetical protein
VSGRGEVFEVKMNINTINININTIEQQLIELLPEESASEILRKKADQQKLRREKISNLQNEVEDLLVCYNY